MTLEDFERELAKSQQADEDLERRRGKQSHRDKTDRRHHRHHQSRRDDGEERDRHRHKRRRRDSDYDDDRKSRRHHHRPSSSAVDKEDSKTTTTSRSEDHEVKRDSWMEAPSAIDVDYMQRKQRNPSPPIQRSLGAEFETKIHEKELNRHLKDVKGDNEAAEPEIDFTFGDSGSQWRMRKLKNVYRQAKESGQSLEKIALDRFGSLQEFDAAREEEIELERRETYGNGYKGKDKPDGGLYKERGLNVQPQSKEEEDSDAEFDKIAEGIAAPAPPPLKKVDQTDVNRLKAQLMKAQLRKDPKLNEIQRQYDEAVANTTAQDPATITLSAMDNRMLSSAPRNEVRPVQNRRGAERGNVEENEDMSIEDMVREERRTKNQQGGESERFADRIAKDAKFDNNLEYMDENASKLARRVHKSGANLRNMAISEYQKLNSILENCPLCHHEDTNTPPVAPVVSLATRTFLTLPTKPELAPYTAMIVPTQHHTNLLEADDDEWEEIRNFMKSLTRFYHDRDQDVIFYENAAHPHRKPHAALAAVPLPFDEGQIAPAVFEEAFLTTEEEWSQHKKVVNTLNKAKQGLGKLAFRRSLAKEAPYFHVWFEMDGGIGHIVENPDRWPKGDLFAREIVGGMLGLEPDVIRRQGRWQRGHDERVEKFRKRWNKFDWTRILAEN